MKKYVGIFVVLALATLPLAASASQRRSMSIEEMLDQSQAVFVGTVLAIDDDVGGDEAMTKVTFAVSETLFGELDDEVDFTMRGGWLPNGSYERWSTVPTFVVGDSYVLFIREGDYTVQPMVRSSSAILRKVNFKDRAVFVDEDGAGIVVGNGKQGAMRRTVKIANSSRDRRVEQEYGQSSQAQIASVEGADISAVKRASTANTLTGRLRAIGKAHSNPGRRMNNGRRPKTLGDGITSRR